MARLVFGASVVVVVASYLAALSASPMTRGHADRGFWFRMSSGSLSEQHLARSKGPAWGYYPRGT